MDDFRSNYERARAEGKSWIRAQAEDKPLTFTGFALAIGFFLGGALL